MTARRNWPYYVIAALLAVFELVVFWQAFHPNVTPEYRAYYIDQTTTCLTHARPGTYKLNTLQSFRSGHEKEVQPIRICGWEGPVGNGLHAVGETSRLHFAVPTEATANGLTFVVEMEALGSAVNGQDVVVSVNGTKIGKVHVVSGHTQRFELPVPAAAMTTPVLEVSLDYPQAMRVGTQDPNTRKRSIMMSAAGFFSGPLPDLPEPGKV